MFVNWVNKLHDISHKKQPKLLTYRCVLAEFNKSIAGKPTKEKLMKNQVNIGK